MVYHHTLSLHWVKRYGAFYETFTVTVAHFNEPTIAKRKLGGDITAKLDQTQIH